MTELNTGNDGEGGGCKVQVAGPERSREIFRVMVGDITVGVLHKPPIVGVAAESVEKVEKCARPGLRAIESLCLHTAR